MAQVRAAISEDRRYGTPEEEIEQLWAEVDRLTHERNRAASSTIPLPPKPEVEPEPEPAGPSGARPPEPKPSRGRVGLPPVKKAPEPPEEELEEDDDAPHLRTIRPSFYSPYVPPEERTAAEAENADALSSAADRARNRPRPRA